MLVLQKLRKYIFYSNTVNSTCDVDSVDNADNLNSSNIRDSYIRINRKMIYSSNRDNVMLNICYYDIKIKILDARTWYGFVRVEISFKNMDISLRVSSDGNIYQSEIKLITQRLNMKWNGLFVH